MTVAERIKLSHLNACTNGNAAANLAVAKKVPKLSSLNQSTVRIIAQYLSDIGLKESVETLVEESGCKVENTHGAKLRKCITKGEWAEALKVIEKCHRYLPKELIDEVRLMILQEKFYSHVRNKEVVKALFLMREEYPQGDEFRNEQADMMRHLYMPVAIFEKSPLANVTKTKAQRKQFATKIQQMMPNDFMLPSKRLVNILHEAKGMEDQNCEILTGGHKNEPLSEHIAKIHSCPPQVAYDYKEVQVLRDHQTEVIIVKFSPDGQLLASACKKNTIIIWKVRNNKTLTRLKTLDAISARGYITYMSWSHDSTFLAVSGSEHTHLSFHTTVFNVPQGTRFRELSYNDHNAILSYSSCAFFSYTTRYLIAANELGVCHVYNMDKRTLEPMKRIVGFRIRCVYGFKDGFRFLASDSHNRVRMYFLDVDNEHNKVPRDETVITEDSVLITFIVHPTEKFILTTTDVNMRLWDLKTKTLIRVFSGAYHRNEYNERHCYTVHSSFGGLHRAFMATGAKRLTDKRSAAKKDNGSVCVYDLEFGRPLMHLVGHKGMVNAVTWHHENPKMLASCSQDGSIRVWHIHDAIIEKMSCMLPRRRKPKESPASRATVFKRIEKQDDAISNGNGVVAETDNTEEDPAVDGQEK